MTPEKRDQRMEALRQANVIRSHRAALKRRLAIGEAKLSESLRSGDTLLSSMRLSELLIAVPQLGPVKARRVCDKLHFSPSMTLERLTPKRREELLSHLVTAHPTLKGRI